MEKIYPSVEMVSPRASRYDGEAPHRKHRRQEPWRDHATGAALLSPKERAVQTTYWPVHSLMRALAANDAFLDAIECVRNGVESADRIARRYVRRAGWAREVMRHVVEKAASSESSNPQMRVLGVAAVAVFVNAPLTQADPAQWTHAKRLREAATMLVRLGSRRCLICDAVLAHDGGRRRYCAAHDSAWRQRADREAILALLNDVGRALRV
jgi:hypothetical protein